MTLCMGRRLIILRDLALPSSFQNTLPLDTDLLKTPLPLSPYPSTPTPFNPLGLPPEDTPRNSLLSRLRTSVDYVHRTSLREERLAALNSPLGSSFRRMFVSGDDRRPSIGLGLQVVHDSVKIDSPIIHLSTSAIDSWRQGVHGAPFLDDNFLCESPTVGSPTETVSVASMKTNL